MKGLILTQSKSPKYGPRTFDNAAMADITVAIAVDFTTHGEVLTLKASKHYLGIPLNNGPLNGARAIYKALVHHNATKINLAGNGIYTLRKHSFSQEDVNQYVYDALSLVHKHYPIAELRSGGQTGVDLSAGVVGPLLGIPTTMHFPLGFKQRHEDGIDRDYTEDDIYRQVEKWQAKITVPSLYVTVSGL